MEIENEHFDGAFYFDKIAVFLILRIEIIDLIVRFMK
jgi:hypothetical protein